MPEDPILLYSLAAYAAISVWMLLLIFLRIRRKHEQLWLGIQARLAEIEKMRQQMEHAVKGEIARNREESLVSARISRQELNENFKQSTDSLLQRMMENAGMQKDLLDSFSKQMGELTRLNEEKLERMRETIETQLRSIQDENSRKLEQVRMTVDEKLQSTLEKRLGESFRQVSERLEAVYKGLGEMRSLATGVGDLKKVLTNVKTRGTWGEIQLGAILEQILAPDQYTANVQTKKGSDARVEFAIKLPGNNNAAGKGGGVWLPIDAKFPQEDYQRLLDAQEAADRESAEKSSKCLEARIKAEARFIKEKYLDPPNTTDFGILFLPVEGLYAEVLRRSGLCELLQRDYRIVITGPTTLAALLNSLQMGFRTLAIEKRSSEVWELLGAVKTEFCNFGSVLAKTKKKLQEASHTIDQAELRTRAIERKLKKVQEIPAESPDR